MRIDPKAITVTPVAIKTARDQVAPESGREDRATVVELSSAGAAAASARPADAGEKIARVRELIDRGEYKVDLELLARRIVEDELAGDPS